MKLIDLPLMVLQPQYTLVVDATKKASPGGTAGDEHCRSVHKMEKSQIKQFDSKRKAKTSHSDRNKLLDKLPTEVGARTMPVSSRSSDSKPGAKVLSETDGNARSGISVPRRMSIELEEARQEDTLDVWKLNHSTRHLRFSRE